MKDLLVSLPSYNRSEEVIVEGRSVNKDFGPNKLERTIKMIFNTCHSKDNFDLQIIINEEQKEIYEYLKQKYPNLIWEYIEKGIAWENIIKAQNTQMQKGYYFFVFFSDDMYGLKPEWDKHILDKKHYFKDDLFVLYTKCIWSGRCPGIFERAYKDECIMTKHESFPIWTYKWGELTYHLFDQFKLGREMLYAEIIRRLNIEGKHNRHVSCDFDCKGLIDNKTTVNLLQNPEIYLYQNMQEPIRHIIGAMIKYIENERNNS